MSWVKGRKKNEDPMLRFFRYVEKTPTCWIWIGGINGSGYGNFYLDHKTKTAHRWILIQIKGPSSLHAPHRCGNRRCVNPDHLYWADRKQNMADKIVHGTLSYGKNHGRTILTEDQVIKIFQSDEKIEDLARKYSCSKGAISGIRYGNNWKRLTGCAK